MQAADWQKLWLGGFCAPGIYGAPVRAAETQPRLTLAQRLTLPSAAGASAGSVHNGDLAPQHVIRHVIKQWSDYVGGRSIIFAASVESAARQLLRVLEVANGERVLLPGNATHALVEAVKAHGAKPSFAHLDADLAPVDEGHCRVFWQQPPLGLPISKSSSAEVAVLDHRDSLPRHAAEASNAVGNADVEIYALRLAHDPRNAGALMVFNNDALYRKALAQQDAVGAGFYGRAGEQLQRLNMLAPAQEAALDLVLTGLQVAAGLPLLPRAASSALAHGVPFCVPEEGSPSQFWSYASHENTPVQWLPNLCPIHYAAISTHAESAAHLERWLFVPVGPEESEVGLRQAVLGVVKTAEYLGLRWRTDPRRAAQYAAHLDEIYGADHDAYRPAFALPAPLEMEDVFNVEDFLTQACSVEPQPL